MTQLVIGLVGHICGGKGTAVKTIQSEYSDTPSLRFSTRMRQLLHLSNEKANRYLSQMDPKDAFFEALEDIYGKGIRTRAIPTVFDPVSRYFHQMMKLGFPLIESREKLQSISTIVRELFGEDTFARKMMEDISSIKSPIVIVEGIRRRADIAALSPMPVFVSVFIEAPIEKRWEWNKQRNENVGDSAMSFDEFCQKDQAETELEIASLKEAADWVILNHGTQQEFVSKVRCMLRETLVHLT